MIGDLEIIYKRSVDWVIDRRVYYCAPDFKDEIELRGLHRTFQLRGNLAFGRVEPQIPTCQDAALSRHSPVSEPVGPDPPFLGASRQQNLLTADRVAAKTAVRLASQRRNLRLGHDEAHLCHGVSRVCRQSSVLPARAADATGRSAPDVGEQLSRHRYLSHLERDVAPVADDLRADLDQLLAQTGQRPRLRGLRHRQRPHEVREIVRQRMELKAYPVGGEGAA